MKPGLLTLLIFFPIVLSIPLLLISEKKANFIRYYSLAVSVITFVLSLFVLFNFNRSESDYQFVEKVQWISQLNSSYYVGIDGISLMLLLLTTFLFPLSILISFEPIKKRVKTYYILMLILEGALIGVFCALDLVLFYVFWEFILIPMYFIIGIWGGEDRIYATVKFFIYTMVGSILLLVGIIWLGFVTTPYLGYYTMELPRLTEVAWLLPTKKQIILFILFTVGFLIKVPLFPFHTWLPDAHVQAPTAGSVILAALLLKMGTYGLIRFSIPLFPLAFLEFTPYIATLSVIGIIYGALLSIVQKDMKKLVAYSSVSHLGFIVLGLCAYNVEAVQGSIIQMVNHGLSTGALFMIVGMLYERRHTKEISEYGGIMKVMPVFAVVFMVVALSSLGLPGLNGFVGEFLILVGSFYSSNLGNPAYAIFSALAVILAAVYLLWLYQRVMTGPITNEQNRYLKDLNKFEYLSIIPILIFIVWIGVYPKTFLSLSEKSVQKVLINYDKAKERLEMEKQQKP